MISVIIPNYNYGRFIGEAIESVLAQTFPPSEIIVVDDGSDDNSADIVRTYGSRVKFIQQRNQGVGAARNNGVKNYSGNLIAFLDDDDVWLPTKLEKQVELLQQDNKIGMVSCGMREFDKNGETIAEYKEGQNGWCAKNILMIEPVVIGPGSTSLVRRNIFEKINGFDENKEMHPSEDWEFCYRVAQVCKIAFVPQILVNYRNHGGNGHLKIPRFERAMLLAYEKIFQQADVETLKLRRQCYGNLFATLAGSYFQAQGYQAFLKNTIKSLWYTPQNITRYLAYPSRLWKRKFPSQNSFFNKQA